MKPELIFGLVDLAVSLAQTQLDSGDIAPTLLDIARRAAQAYRDHTGETLDPKLIAVEARL
jgi:hypothetical protein